MANMSYCKFENTFSDLKDCYDSLHDEDLNEYEKAFRKKLIRLCREIAEEGEDYLEVKQGDKNED